MALSTRSRKLLTTAGAAVGAVALVLPLAVSAPLSRDGGPEQVRANPIAAEATNRSDPAALPPETGLEAYVPAQPRSPQTGAETSAPVVSAPGRATPARLTADHPACGPGLTLVELDGGAVPDSCVHTVSDPVPTRPAGKGAIRMDPICHGNGVNGPRIQFLYVYAQGQPNRAAEYIPHMINSWIPAMEGAFRSTSKDQGREIGMRPYMPGCEIEIGVVELPAEEAEPDRPGAMRSRIEQAVRAAGYTQSNLKFHAWFDGANRGACGVAPVLPVRGVGDHFSPANPNNLGSTPVVNVMPQVAVTFKHPFPVPPGVNAAPACWGRGAMGAVTEIHELLHLFGSVMYSAPNSNGLGHCRDEVDIMCYSEGGVQTEIRCNVAVELLDCGSDDYFNARPAVGSYLSTHWNTADSKFLGTALEDNVPAELPRP
ncbi:MAG: hypothetical protein KY395_05075 [Actinobacteria bacterium]|nr:hypothetical protein [Actinomycetota bacterium]